MEVKKNTPPPVAETYDIIGLTEREAGALKELVMGGIVWDIQPDGLADFFHELYSALPSAAPRVRLKFRDNED